MNLISSFEIFKSLRVLDGGQGSGNFDHSGRPGQVGGSGSGGQATDDYTRGFMAYIGLNVSNLMKNYGIRVEVFTKGINRMVEKGEMPFKDEQSYETAKKELNTITDLNVKKKLQNAINRQELYKKVKEYMQINPIEGGNKEKVSTKKEEIKQKPLVKAEVKAKKEEKSKKETKPGAEEKHSATPAASNNTVSIQSTIKANAKIKRSPNKTDGRFIEFYKEAAKKPEISNEFVNSNINDFYVLTRGKSRNASIADAKDMLKKMMPHLSDNFVNSLYDESPRGKHGVDADEAMDYAAGLENEAAKNVDLNKIVKDDGIRKLLSAMTIGVESYSMVKERNEFGVLNQLNMICASAPVYGGFLVRYESENSNFRDYENLKPGDRFEMESQHFTTSEGLEKDAANWFGDGKPVRIRVLGRLPFFSLEPFVWNSEEGVKPTTEHEGLVAGFVKVKSNEIKNGVRHIELEYDWEKHKDYLRLQAKAFAHKTKMYENKDAGK